MVISNTCLGGYIYRYNKSDFDHPFNWVRIGIDDYIYLIENINNINFNNVIFNSTEVKIAYYGENNKIILKPRKVYNLFIDNKINIAYPHHSLDKYNVDYIENIYFKRLLRLNLNKKILFTYNYGTLYDYDTESEQVHKLYRLMYDYNILVFNNINDNYVYNKNSRMFFLADRISEFKIFKDYLFD